MGRNWVTTKAHINDFVTNNKNGFNEIVDDTGTKIQVHVQSGIRNGEQSVARPFMGNQEADESTYAEASADRSARYNSPAPDYRTGRLSLLKQEVLQSLED